MPPTCGQFLLIVLALYILFFFFFNDTATTEIYTLSLHDALPIYPNFTGAGRCLTDAEGRYRFVTIRQRDRKSTRLNSSHSQISYAVFCLKKKNMYQFKITQR